MKSFRLLVPLTYLLLLASVGRAQMHAPKELAVIKAQPLVVLLEEEDPNQLKKLADKPDDLTQYKDYVASYNAQMREMAPKLWHYSSTVEFKQKSELEALRKLKNTRTVVLQHTEDKDYVYDNGRMHNRFSQTSSGSAVVTTMELSVVGDGRQNYQITSAMAPGTVYSSDILFAFRTLQRRLQDEEEGRDRATETKPQKSARLAEQGQKIRTKIVLIDQADIDQKLTAADIKQLYPFPCQLVPRQTIETAISNADARYVYVRWLTFAPGNIGPTLIDATDSQVLGLSESTVGTGRIVKTPDPITKGDLTAFAFFARYGLGRAN